jgi:hypothetical protein
MTTAAPPQDIWISVEAADGRIYVRWSAPDSETFSSMKSDWRAWMPTHHHTTWASERGAWSCPAHLRSRIAEWCEAWAGGNVTWEEQPKAHSSANHRTGSARTGPIGKSTSLDAAYRVLHLRKSAPPVLVKAARRALATLHHSDHHGGSDEVMASINSACDAILASLAAPASESIEF